jgi:predicted Zn-dependent protease
MAGAGYHPEGLARMFEELLERRRGRPSSVQQFFSSHPLTEDRVEAVRSMAASMSTAGLKRDEPGFQQAQRRAGG